jgi:hypothetical protein
LQAVELGSHPELRVGEGKLPFGPLVDNDPVSPVRFGFLRGPRFRGLVLGKLPDGWKKG